MKFLALILFVTCAAHASDTPSFDEESTETVTCEHFLRGKASENARRALQRDLLDRPFNFSYMYGASPRTLLKMALPIFVTIGELKQAIFRIEAEDPSGNVDGLNYRAQKMNRVGVTDLLLGTFPESLPTKWQIAAVLPNEPLHPRKLVLQNPPAPQKAHLQSTDVLGYVSDPDVEGVRRYLSARYDQHTQNYVAQLGIDVPCDKTAYFGMHPDDEVKIVNQMTALCRIPVLDFVAPRLFNEEF